jgi:hypothetical protein
VGKGDVLVYEMSARVVLGLGDAEKDLFTTVGAGGGIIEFGD